MAGSTATALADRYDRPGSFAVGRSICPHCRQPLQWGELIPIVSWLRQRGRCRSCQWPIGWEVLGIEIGAALVGAVATARFGVSWPLPWLWWALVGLGALTLTDLADQLLPDRLVLFTLPALLALGLAVPTVHLTLITALLGLLGGGGLPGLIWLSSRGRGIGLGDVKLAAVFGVALGYPLILVNLWWASILGGLVAAGLLATGRARLGVGTRVAFGPLLILGYIAALLWGHGLLAWFGLV